MRGATEPGVMPGGGSKKEETVAWEPGGSDFCFVSDLGS